MFIKEIVICNLFAYYGEQSVKFEEKDGRNLYIIMADNGYGKTSFIRCAKLLFNGVLIDSELDVYADDNFIAKMTKTTPRTISAADFIQGSNNKEKWGGFVNRKAFKEMQHKYFVEFKGSLNEEEFILKRSWINIANKQWEEKLYFKQGQKEFEDKMAQEMLEKILPKGFIEFFFFDGEEVQELTDSLNTKLKDKISDILGISSLEILKKAIDTTKKKIEEENNKNEELKIKIQELEAKLEPSENKVNLLEKQLNQIKEDIANKNDEHISLNQKINSLHAQSSQESANLTSAIVSKENELERLKKQILNELPKLFLLNETLPELQMLLEQSMQNNALENIKALRVLMPDILSLAKEQELGRSTSEFLEKLPESLIKKSGCDDEIYIASNLKEKININLGVIESFNLAANISQIISLKEEIKALVSQRLIASNDESTKERIKSLEEQIAQNRQELDSLNEQKSQKQEEKIGLNLSIDSVKKELENLKSANKIERNDEKTQMLMDIKEAILDYKDKLLKSCKNELESNILEFYKLMINNDNIAKLSINDEFEMKFFNTQNEIIALANQSAGQKQILAMAIFWALSKLSNKNIPFIIDTPLSRIDLKNRQNIINNFYKNAAKEVIILPTISEMSENELSQARENIAEIYDISNNNEREEAKIIRRENGGF